MKTIGLPRRRPEGFTLIELMVVVAIIAILAAIALPIYSSYVTRSKLTDAQNNLSAARVSMEQFYQDYRQYASTGSATTCGATMPATSAYFSYSCVPTTVTVTGATGTSATEPGYTITATGISGTQTAAFTFTIDQSNNRGTTSADGWYAVPQTTCWVTSKGVCQ